MIKSLFTRKSPWVYGPYTWPVLIKVPNCNVNKVMTYLVSSFIYGLIQMKTLKSLKNIEQVITCTILLSKDQTVDIKRRQPLTLCFLKTFKFVLVAETYKIRENSSEASQKFCWVVGGVPWDLLRLPCTEKTILPIPLILNGI